MLSIGVLTQEKALARLGKRDRLKIGNHTWLVRVGDTCAVRYHDTNIVEYQHDGTYRLHNGGFQTSTTKERMTELIPGRVYQHKWKWYVQYMDGSTERYFNGMHVS